MDLFFSKISNAMIKHSMNQFFSLAVLLGVGIQSCATANAQVSPSSEAIQTAGAIPTVIPPTDTPTPTIPFSERLSCWPIVPLEKGNDIKGSILFNIWNRNDTKFVWDVSSFRTRKLDYSSSWYEVSPDGSFVTILLYEEKKLLLVSSTQTKTYSLPEGEYLSGISRILPNGLIYVGVMRDELSSSYTDSGFTDKYYLLDPATGKVTLNSIFLSNFEIGPRVYRFPIEYSPDLQYVIYKTRSYADENYQFALMNVKTNEIVWTDTYMPHWKPDGSALTSLGGNLDSLSKDGKSSQMTRFEQKVFFGFGGGLHETIPWSSDGRYVAFLEYQPTLGLFYIWDDQEKVAFRPCLPDELRAYTDYHVHWSFDSKHLLIRLIYPDAPPQSEMPPPTHFVDLILDMRTQTIFELPDESNRGQYGLQAPEGANIVGWVNWEIP